MSDAEEIPNITTKEISTVIEVDEEDEFPNFNETRNYEDIPYYEQRLISFLGKEKAESYLRPVIDVSVGVIGMSAKLQSTASTKKYGKLGSIRNRNEVITLDKLRSNAVRLWEILRENSTLDIKHVDDNIPVELKQTFSSVARSDINKHLIPPQRSFVNDTEVQKMTDKMKTSNSRKIDMATRKRILMKNLSQVQENTQQLLMRDKSFLRESIPDDNFRDLFLPPLVIPQETEMEPRARQWTSKEILKNLDIKLEHENELFQRKPTTPEQRLRFFTEADSRAILNEDGNFRQKTHFQNQFKDKGDTEVPIDPIMNKIIHQTERWMKSDSATLKQQKEAAEKEEENEIEWKLNRTKSREMSECSDKMKQKKKVKPLTLGAVMDFQITRGPTLMDDNEIGRFRQGAVRLWRPNLTHA